MDSNLQIVDQWAIWMAAGGLEPGSVEVRTRHVRKVLRDLQRTAQDVTVEDLVRYFAAQTWMPNTRRSYRTSLRQFFGWLYDSGAIAHNPAGLVPKVRVPRALPRPLPEEALRTGRQRADARVLLMIELGAVCGLRRIEITRARREDVFKDLEGYALRIRGKGGHERDVPMPLWIATRILAMPPGHLFPSPMRPGRPLTAAHVGKLINAALPDDWTCHTLRHRCASVGYGDTRDLRAIQELLGHLSAETTAVYTKVPRGAIRAAVEAAAA